MASVNGNIYSWRGLNCVFLDGSVAFESQGTSSLLLLFVKQITLEATNHPIFFYLFIYFPPAGSPPARSLRDKQPMVISRCLPASQGDYFFTSGEPDDKRSRWAAGAAAEAAAKAAAPFMHFALYVLQFCILLPKENLSTTNGYCHYCNDCHLYLKSLSCLIV